MSLQTSTNSVVKHGLRSLLGDLAGLSAESTLIRCNMLLRQHRIQGSRDCAVATVETFRHVLELEENLSIGETILYVRDVGTQLQGAQPSQKVITNITRRVLGLFSEVTENQTQAYNANHAVGAKYLTSEPFITIKDDLLDGISEMRDEVDSAEEQISSYAPEHVHSNDCILTFAASRQIQRFLLSAARKVSTRGPAFTVICVENYPQEQEMVFDTILNGKARGNNDEDNNRVRYKNLTSAGIKTICIPDNAVMTVMPRVTKAILPANALFPSGGSECPSGARMIAKAAGFYGVPVIVLGAIYSLSSKDRLRKPLKFAIEDSGRLVRYEDGTFLEGVNLIDSVPEDLSPDDITLIITNIGSYVPTFMYKIATDHYRKENETDG